MIMLRYCLASWVMRVCSGMWPGNTDISTQMGWGWRGGGVLGFHPMVWSLDTQGTLEV